MRSRVAAISKKSDQCQITTPSVVATGLSVADLNDRLLTTANAARFLDMHPTTLRKWRSVNIGPAYLVLPNGYSIRYRLADLRAWVQPAGGGA
jgi:hypothetical protein